MGVPRGWSRSSRRERSGALKPVLYERYIVSGCKIDFATNIAQTQSSLRPARDHRLPLLRERLPRSLIASRTRLQASYCSPASPVLFGGRVLGVMDELESGKAFSRGPEHPGPARNAAASRRPPPGVSLGILIPLLPAGSGDARCGHPGEGSGQISSNSPKRRRAY